MTDSCCYLAAYTFNRCGLPADDSGLCEKHRESLCASCKAQATHECSYCGQFVCGAPLCDACEGWEDRTQPSGSWGFMNHSHRPKALLARIEEPGA